MKNFLFFERTLYLIPLEKSFYRFCLLGQPSLIKYFFIRLYIGFMRFVGVASAERYANLRWRFLKSVTNLELRAEKYWSLNRHRIYDVLSGEEKLWISRYPEQVLLPLAQKHGAQLVANSFDMIEGRFDSYQSFEELFKKAARIVRPGRVIDGPRRAVKTGLETLHMFNGKLFRSKTACRRYQVLTGMFTFLVLLCMGVGLGLMSMYFGASYMLLQMFLSYFSKPLIPVLNILPVVVLVFLTYLIFNRVWLSFLTSSVFTMLLTWINYFKLMLRNDPLLASDFTLISETGKMLDRYTLNINWKIIVSIVFLAAVTIGAALLVRSKVKSLRLRVGGILVAVCLCVFCYMTVYTSPAVYQKTENLGLINRWSATQQYISRGFVYPFIHSIQTAVVKPPDGYDKDSAKEQFFEYDYDDIPAGEKVNIVVVMLEAFNDFTKFDQIEFKEDVYAPWRELKEKSYSGELITNIFAGGTVDTEWSFLTGFSENENFRSNVNSYVRYFKEQGYYTEGSHPCYEWFYNRLNVNQYLGFDNYYYYENKYYDLSGGIAEDKILIPEIIALYERHVENQDTPYFSFNVTYQNHGPYSGETLMYDREFVVDKGYSEGTLNILNNYFGGIGDTLKRIKEMADYFEGRGEPVVLIVFGDHNPWLGDENSVYKELGINFDFDSQEGFMNYYCAPYIIFANDAAKQALGNDFTGEGEAISPCFLMNEFFELSGWAGNEFMKLASEVRAVTPLVHKYGLYIIDGELTSDIPEEAYGLMDKYKKLQYYWRWNYKEK